MHITYNADVLALRVNTYDHQDDVKDAVSPTLSETWLSAGLSGDEVELAADVLTTVFSAAGQPAFELVGMPERAIERRADVYAHPSYDRAGHVDGFEYRAWLTWTVDDTPHQVLLATNENPAQHWLFGDDYWAPPSDKVVHAAGRIVSLLNAELAKTAAAFDALTATIRSSAASR